LNYAKAAAIIFAAARTISWIILGGHKTSSATALQTSTPDQEVVISQNKISG
jgi:hypothetical protein